MPKISDLNPTSFPSLLHELAAAKDNETVKITVGQIRELMKFKGSEITASLLESDDTTVQNFLELLNQNKVETSDYGQTINGLMQDLVDLSDSISTTNTNLSNLSADTVRLSAQSLSSAQRKQVRTNLRTPSGDCRNVLINPLFSINQRAVSGTVVLAAGAWGHDRMKAGNAGCTYTFSTNNGVTTLNITAGSLMQIIEAGNFAGRAGTYFLSWTGTAQGRIMADPYGASGTVSKVCDGSSNISVEFTGGTVSLVQFERDYVTEFSMPSLPEDYSNARRYYANMRLTYSGNCVLGFTSFNRQWINPPMRIAPTVTGVVATQNGFSSTLANAAAGPETCIIGITATATLSNSEFTVDTKLNAEI